MPSLFLERLPLPSLRTYVSFSVALLAFTVYYANRTVKAKINYDPENHQEGDPYLPADLVNLTLPYATDDHFLNMMYVMRLEAWSVWALVNSSYCLLILLGRLIQTIVFGNLRVVEMLHLKEFFWNFVFYKFIFIFGVMNVQSMEEVVLWVAWFSTLGFLHVLTLLSKDRFEYLSFSPATPRSAHVKLMSLLVCTLLACNALLALCIWVAINVSITIFAFLAAESLLILLKCLSVVTRYWIQLYDMSLDTVWESRSSYVYYSELVIELVGLTIDFSHHLHMLLYGNIFLSMASLVICMQLRQLLNDLRRRIKRHKNYLRVVKDMEAKFSMATQEELEQNADDCAICWEGMESARKLPCGHLFHDSCLRSWLEQDTSCPTCRTTLNNSPTPGPLTDEPTPPNLGEAIGAAGNQSTTNHFFHFDGSRYVSWLPSFSVEVTHTNLLPGQQAHATQTSQLDQMAREVQQVFPALPQAAIIEDLRLTRSVDLTIDNILEGRIVTPPQVSSGNPVDMQIAIHPLEPHTSNSSANPAVQRSEISESLTPQFADSQLLELRPSTSSSVDPPTMNQNMTVGGRFSKSPSERTSMLQERKRSMIDQARRRYEAKQATVSPLAEGEEIPANSSTHTSSTASSTVTHSSSLSTTTSSSSICDNALSVQRNSATTSDSNSTTSESSSVPQAMSGQEEQEHRRAVLLGATVRRLQQELDRANS